MKPIKTLDINEDIKVEYCIDLVTRDLQMETNIKKISDRLEPGLIKDEEPIAIVCYGPSLKKTWKKISNFKTIISCSGAHKFLLEKGIIPTYQVEVDPRIHKIQLLGTPCKDTTYLPASCIHPKYIDHLISHDCKIKLWHVFANGENGETCSNIFPRGEWTIVGGSSVGLRAITIARFMGYTNLHIFGLDGNLDDKANTHAGDHPNAPKDYAEVEYNGKTWKTTSSYLVCAKQTFHELNQLPDLKVKMYGTGLTQAMFKDWVPNYVTAEKSIIAILREPTISKEYIDLNRQLHESNTMYGAGDYKYKDTVIKLKESIKANSILNYGAGKRTLAKSLDFPIFEYDPAVPEISQSPKPADLVLSFDVLEHIEPNLLVFVLDDLRRVTRRLGYFVIATKPAIKTYANGENTHLIQQGLEWWKHKLEQFFDVGKIMDKGGKLHVIVTPLTQKVKKLDKIQLAK